jgi:hypothetical protein
MTETTATSARHETPEPARSLREELRDAIAPRTVVLVLGVLALQVGFILSYVGAFHSPRPHRLELLVVAPAQSSSHGVAQLNAISGAPLRARAVGSETAARAALRRGDAPAALVIRPGGTTDTLLVASAKGTSTVTAAESVLSAVERSRHRALHVVDVVPLQDRDGRGLTGFYLVIGWIVGGYLVASLLGVAKGARPANTRRAVIRLASLVPYALASGLLGAVVVGPLLGALTGHVLGLWALGTLLVFASAAVTMAFQVLFGVLGIGITVLVFVVLGNPSAGGAYQPALLPPFWRSISSALPNGAGTDSVRRIVYFGSHGVGEHLLVIALYAVLGAAVTVLATLRTSRRRAQAVPTPS